MDASAIKMRLRTKLSLLIAGLVIAVMLPLSFIFSARDAHNREEDMRRQSEAIAKLVAQVRVMSALSGKPLRSDLLQNYIELAMSIDPSLAYIAMTDTNDQLIAGQVNSELVHMETSQSKKEVLRRLSQEGRGTDPDLRAVSVEITEDDRSLGRVKLGFSVAATREEIHQDIVKNAVLTLLLITLGIALSHGFARRISKPIETLAQGMSRVREGDFDAKVTIGSRDEIASLADNFNVMTQGLKEREWIKTTFARYVSRQIADKILKGKKDLDFDGDLRNVTILFADIRGFSALSETLGPRDVVRLLNQYFDAMIDVIFKYEGTLDKFVGDQVMALYGAPLQQDMPELRAVKTGLEMQQAISALNERRARNNQTTIQIGIGINTGEVVAGNIGSEKRMEYTVIGDEVNIAERIEESALRGQVLISERTYQAVKADVEAMPLLEAKVRGRKEPVQVYSVVRLR